jgi:hypothetical protein
MVLDRRKKRSRIQHSLTRLIYHHKQIHMSTLTHKIKKLNIKNLFRLRIWNLRKILYPIKILQKNLIMKRIFSRAHIHQSNLSTKKKDRRFLTLNFNHRERVAVRIILERRVFDINSSKVRYFLI